MSFFLDSSKRYVPIVRKNLLLLGFLGNTITTCSGSTFLEGGLLGCVGLGTCVTLQLVSRVNCVHLFGLVDIA